MRPGQSYNDLRKSDTWSIAPGDRVRHAAHGEGVVSRVSSLGQLNVKFSSGQHTVPIKSVQPLENKRREFPHHMKTVWAK